MVSQSHIFGKLFLLFVFQTFPGIDFTPEENLSISGIPTKKEGKVRPYFASTTRLSFIHPAHPPMFH